MTPKQRATLEFINAQLLATGICPSFEEMRLQAGLASKSGVSRLVEALLERGLLGSEVKQDRFRFGRSRMLFVTPKGRAALAQKAGWLTDVPTEALEAEIERRRAA